MVQGLGFRVGAHKLNLTQHPKSNAHLLNSTKSTDHQEEEESSSEDAFQRLWIFMCQRAKRFFRV